MSREVVQCPDCIQDGTVGALEVQEVVVGLGDRRRVALNAGGARRSSSPPILIQAAFRLRLSSPRVASSVVLHIK